MKELVTHLLEQAVAAELERANELYPAFNSAHELESVLREELEEVEEELAYINDEFRSLWRNIRKNNTTEQSDCISYMGKLAYKFQTEVNQFYAMIRKAQMFYELEKVEKEDPCGPVAQGARLDKALIDFWKKQAAKEKKAGDEFMAFLLDFDGKVVGKKVTFRKYEPLKKVDRHFVHVNDTIHGEADPLMKIFCEKDGVRMAEPGRTYAEGEPIELLTDDTPIQDDANGTFEYEPLEMFEKWIDDTPVPEHSGYFYTEKEAKEFMLAHEIENLRQSRAKYARELNGEWNCDCMDNPLDVEPVKVVIWQRCKKKES